MAFGAAEGSTGTIIPCSTACRMMREAIARFAVAIPAFPGISASQPGAGRSGVSSLG